MLRLFFSLPVVVAQTSFSSKSSLQGALAEWCGNPASAEAAHGHISAWDTGAVTDMSGLVANAPCRSTFNGPIGSWDVAQVTNMEYMFIVRPEPLPHRASAREPPALPAARRLCTPRAPEHPSPPPLRTWQEASRFNQPLDWDVAQVTSMRDMFQVRPGLLPSIAPPHASFLPCLQPAAAAHHTRA